MVKALKCGLGEEGNLKYQDEVPVGEEGKRGGLVGIRKNRSTVCD